MILRMLFLLLVLALTPSQLIGDVLYTGGNVAVTDPITGRTHYVQATAPATCNIADTWFDTDATAGENVYGCTSANIFTLQSAGSRGVADGIATLDSNAKHTATEYLVDHVHEGQSGAPGDTCTGVGHFNVDTDAGGKTYRCRGAGENFEPITDQSDDYDGITDGINAAAAAAATAGGGETLRIVTAPSSSASATEVFNGTGTFSTQPDDDGFEVISDSASDTQTFTVYGTTFGGDQSAVVIETGTVNGTSQVVLTKTDWDDGLAFALNTPAVGTVTLREASGNATVTTITAGNSRSANQDTVFVRAGFDGKIDRNNDAVNDDDCTGEQGLWWYDTTDSAFEFCNANSGVPAVLGGGGGGSGTTLVTFRATQNFPPTSIFATSDTRNYPAVLDFDDTVDEEAMFCDVMPAIYAGGGVTVVLGWAATDTST